MLAHLKLARRIGNEWEVALPVELNGTLPTGPAPRVGEHTDELLAVLGYSRAEADHLRALNAVA